MRAVLGDIRTPHAYELRGLKVESSPWVKSTSLQRQSKISNLILLKTFSCNFFVIENHKKKDRQQIELSTGLYIAFPSLSTSNLNV